MNGLFLPDCLIHEIILPLRFQALTSFMWSIKTKILLITFSLMLTVSIGSSIYWSKKQEAKLLESYLRELVHYGDFEHEILNNFYRQLQQDILLLAKTVEIPDLLFDAKNHDNPDRTLASKSSVIEKVFQGFLQQKPFYFQIRLISALQNGQEIIRLERTAEQIMQTPAHQLQNKSQRPYYRNTLEIKENEVHFSPINPNIENNQIDFPLKPTLRVSTPIYHNHERLLGILVINADIRHLIDKLEDHLPVQVNQLNVQNYLANRNGVWLIHPDESQMFADAMGRSDNLNIEFPALAPYLNNHSFNDFAAELIPVKQNSAYAYLQKQSIDVTPDIETLFSVYVLDKSIINENLKSIYLQILITAFLTSAVVIIGMLFIINKQLKPINALVRVSTVIANGFYKVELPEAHDKETASLVNALNNLRLAVQEREKRLIESEARSNVIIENVPVGILMINSKGDIQQVNSELENMTGYEDGELLGLPVETLVPDSLRNKHIHFRQHFIDEQGSRELDKEGNLHAQRKDKSQFPVQIGLASMNFENQTYILATIIDITHKIQTEERLWQEANFDTLTKLPNRKLFYELLEQEQRLAHRNKNMLWLLFLDLDGFKEINDTYGHDKGDQLLIEVAGRLKSKMRETDVFARLGGDEFVILLSGIEQVADVNRLVEIYIKCFEKPFLDENKEAFVSTSIGIANYPADATNTTDLMRFADQAMYQAKNRGKNRAHFFTPALQEASVMRLQIANDLRRAIERDELTLFYQPIVDLTTGEVCKAEALIRWNHPQKGMISPAGFIPIAEETGVIHDIGRWIFAEVMSRFNNVSAGLLENLQISINVSPVQLTASDEHYNCFIDNLKNSQLSGKNIVIEFTEGLLLSNEPQVSRRLINFRDNNVQVAIDDFGTGYSSLAYLKEFDIDYIKIDQSFTKNLQPGASEESLIEAIIVMAHKLDMKVIIEGVETMEQMQIVKAMGCDYGQGYLFSRPVPYETFMQNFATCKTPFEFI